MAREDISFLPDKPQDQIDEHTDLSFLPDQADFSFLPDKPGETASQKVTRLQSENQKNKSTDEYANRGYGELSTPDYDKDKSIYYPGELRETFNQAFKTGFSGKKIENDVLARENPRMTFVGGVLGGLMPYLIPGGGMVKMAAIPFAREGVRQLTTPEEKLNTMQRAGKLTTAGTFGAITGKLFDLAALKPVSVKNIFDTAAKVSALSIPESMAQDKISGKAVDIKNALYNAGTNFAIMALLGAADHISTGPFRKMVINEAYKLRKAESVVNTKKPFTYEEAKALLQKNMVPIETLDPMTQAAIRGIQQEGAKAEISAFAKEYGFDKKVVDGVFSSDKNVQLKSLETLLSKGERGYTKPGDPQTYVTKAGQAYTKLKNQYELLKNNPEADITDIIINHKIIERLVPETKMTDTAKPKEAVAQDAEYENWLKSTMGLSPTITDQAQDQAAVQAALRRAEVNKVIEQDATLFGLNKIPGQLTSEINLSPAAPQAAVAAPEAPIAPELIPEAPVEIAGIPKENMTEEDYNIHVAAQAENNEQQTPALEQPAGKKPIVAAEKPVTATEKIKVVKSKKVPILERKDELLTDIKQAIEKAPNIDPTDDTPKITFQLDGGAKIYNTKKSLTEFHDRIKSTPKNMFIGEHTGKTPNAKPTGDIYQSILKNIKTLKSKPSPDQGQIAVQEENLANFKPNFTERITITKSDSKPISIQYDYANETLIDPAGNKKKMPVVDYEEQKEITVETKKEQGYEVKIDQSILNNERGSVNLFSDINWSNSNKRAEEIINGSTSIVDAQERIANEFGIKLSIEQLEAMRRKSNTGLFDFSFTKEAFDQLISNIRKDKESAKIFDNLGLDNFDIDPEALKESMSIAGVAKERFENMKAGIKHAVNWIEQPQVYLYYHSSTKPIAEGVIDAKQQLLKNLSFIESWQHIAANIDSPETMKKIAADVDRDPNGNMFAALQMALRKGTVTAKDVDAYTKAYYYMHKYVYDAIRKEIIEGKTGIRIKYLGNYYNISYTLKSGQRSQRMVTEAELKYLQGKYGDVEVVDQVQKYNFKKLNPETGEYEKNNYYLHDYQEALDIQDQEIQELLDELLPYSPENGNYFPHSREQGGWWVEAYDLNAEGKEKIFSARVPLKAHAEAVAKEMEAKLGATARVEVKPDNKRDKFMPSMGKMVDMMYFLNQAGVKVNSEAGQKIINSYRQMSGLFSHLIHAKNIPGFKTEWKDLVQSMGDIARSAAKRDFRANIEDLFDLVPSIPDDFRANIATRYLKIMSSMEHNNPLLDASINLTYFTALANKMSYITQNMSEVIWSLAKVPKLNSDVRFLMPLEQEYKDLLLKGKQEGIIKPFFVEEAERSGVMRKMDILGRASEVWSSKKSFEIGLRIARDRGLHGEEAYQSAYQFLFNVAKPFYNPANRMNALLKTEGSWVRKYGFIFLTWSHNFFDQFAHVPMRNKFNILLFWVLIAGLGTLPIPYMKTIMEKLGIVNKVKDPRRYDIMDRFLLGGFLGAMGISSRFIVPSSFRGVGNIGDLSNSFDILASMAQRAKMSYKKYGLPGLAAELPLGGLQQPIKAYLSTKKGYYAGSQEKPFYRPKSGSEKAVSVLGYTPFAVGERYAKSNKGFFENWGKKKTREELMKKHGIKGFGSSNGKRGFGR